MTLASRVVEAYCITGPMAFSSMEEVSVVALLIDLRQLRVPVIEVQFGAKSDNNFGASESGIQYANKRAEIWGSLKEWLAVGAIPDLPDLISRTHRAGVRFFNVSKKFSSSPRKHA
jgi:hypothetical protein